MSESKYEKFAVRKPIYDKGYPDVRGRQAPPMTFLNSKLIPGINYYIEFGWIYDIPQPNLQIGEYVLDYDEILLNIGCNSDKPQDLGGTIEFYLGSQPIIFNTTTSVFIPKGIDHGPLIWKEVRKPLIEMAIMLGAGTLAEGWENSFFDLPDGSRRGPN